MDHIIPACLFSSRGVATTWENITTACKTCNHGKADKLPEEFGIDPINAPRVPHIAQALFAGKLNPYQKEYVLDYYNLRGDEIVI